jgi:hypothetical protein
VLDMMEPQDHPNDIPYPGAGPKAPYDAAGWTMAYTMGVQFDRILDAFEAPVEEIKDLELPPPPGKVSGATGAIGFFLDTRLNDSFRAVNRLMQAGQEVRRLQAPVTEQGVTYSAGTFFIPRGDKTLPLLEETASKVGTSFVGVPTAPGKEAVVLKPVRVGLWDSKPGGSMPSGWTRWLLERFEFPFQVVYNNDLTSGPLNEKFDVLLFVEGGVGGGGGKGGFGGGGKGGGKAGGKGGAQAKDKAAAKDKDAPGGAGEDNNTTKQLKSFLEAGGTILTVGGATGLGKQVGLPVDNHVGGLSRDKYYIPSSVLRVHVNKDNSLAWGMDEYADVVFSNSPTFKLPDEPGSAAMNKVAWFDTKTPLRSGWAMGQENLDGGVAMIDAKVGKGRLAMFGPSVLYRGQPHGTFKLFFNGIVQAGVKE